jgi:hypothetical protein
MTTIDVNTGGFVGVRNFDDTIFKTNLEAAQTIARQLRLRNLGGIIIVDFIDMENEEHRSAVLSEFNKALARDHTRLTVNGFTALGLVEMTRKRTRESLAHVLCETCPTCDGRGEVRTARTVCYEILRELLREARQFNAREYRVLGSQAVIDIFLDEESQGWRCSPTSSASRSRCRPSPAIRTQEQYDIVLMYVGQHGGNEAGRKHAVGDAAAELGALGVILVQMRRIDVGRHAGEHDDVGLGHGLADAGAHAGLQVFDVVAAYLVHETVLLGSCPREVAYTVHTSSQCTQGDNR